MSLPAAISKVKQVKSMIFYSMQYTPLNYKQLVSDLDTANVGAALCLLPTYLFTVNF